MMHAAATPPEPDEDEARQPPETLPGDGEDVPEVVARPEQRRIQQFITEIRSAEHQVGEHVLKALEDDDTVAVLTAIVGGPHGQRIVSAALGPEMLDLVQRVLFQAQHERQERVPCIGFHCYVGRRTDQDGARQDGAEQTGG